MSPRKQDVEVMYGTLDLMILKTLSWGPRHGLAILLWINDVTGNRLVIEEGALYPALHRMERKGWLDAEWGISDKGRQAKFYSLTRAGRTALNAQQSRWAEYTRIVDLVLQARGAS
ncbi:MAG: PadR family transcriptional regulator [Gemmatimonadaceae bacterium]